MTVWSGELRLAGETTAQVGVEGFGFGHRGERGELVGDLGADVGDEG